MPDGLLGALKLCLLALLYLFFLRVLRAVWSELKGPKMREPKAPKPPKPSRADRKQPSQVVVTAPNNRQGTTFALTSEMTVGRAPGCSIPVEDNFASQLHARIFLVGRHPYVEDLGSTNGTTVNGQAITQQVPLARGDKIAIGGTVLEVR